MPYTATPLIDGGTFMGETLSLGCTASHLLYAPRIKSRGGKVVMASIGASVQNQISSRLIQRIPELTNAQFKFVNLCQVSQGTEDWLDNEDVWAEVTTRLTSEDVLYSDIQIVWLQEDSLALADTSFPSRAITVKNDLRSLIDLLKLKFPNLKQVFVSARPYSGYSTDPTFTEPKAYYNGFSCKWLVQDQINGLSPLYPWICDLPYMWTSADELRSDGFQAQDTDWKPDDVHLSADGKIKFGDWLFDFFKTNSVSKKYFK